MGSWVSPPVSPEKPLRTEHRLCWWPGGPPGEPPRPGGSEQEGRSEPRGFTPARGQRCCHWAAGGRALSGVATRWALKEACRLEVGRGCCGGRGSWERRAFVGRGAGAPTETFLWSGAGQWVWLRLLIRSSSQGWGRFPVSCSPRSLFEDRSGTLLRMLSGGRCLWPTQQVVRQNQEWQRGWGVGRPAGTVSWG